MKKNFVDWLGQRHWHEVPSVGRFRLKSACGACDYIADFHP